MRKRHDNRNGHNLRDSRSRSSCFESTIKGLKSARLHLRTAEIS
jgi:hypothetical protein